eukprot:Gb_17245 [translate_table: standard]
MIVVGGYHSRRDSNVGGVSRRKVALDICRQRTICMSKECKVDPLSEDSRSLSRSEDNPLSVALYCCRTPIHRCLSPQPVGALIAQRISCSVFTSMEDGQQCSTGSREQNGASSLMGCYIKIKICPMRWTARQWWLFSQQTLYPVLQPIGLAVVAASNPDRPVDSVNTIRMLLTSAKANTAAGYQSVSVEDEGRDRDYISLACLGMRQSSHREVLLEHILEQFSIKLQVKNNPHLKSWRRALVVHLGIWSIMELRYARFKCHYGGRWWRRSPGVKESRKTHVIQFVEHLQKMKEVKNQLEGVGEIVADKEMVMPTIISLPREGPTNLGPFITSLCTQRRVRSIPFNESESLLLQEESLRNAGTNKGDSSGSYAINHQGKATMQKKSGG